MNRRGMLKGLALGIGGASVPLWLARPFGLRTVCEEPSEGEAIEVTLAELEAPQAPASAPLCEAPTTEGPCAPRPRLFFVIPEDQGERYFRGHAFGELLNHGEEITLARLALVEVRCASAPEIAAEAGKAIAGEPWMVLVDRSAGAVKVTILDDAKLREETEVTFDRRRRGGDEEEAMIDARIRRLAALIDAGVGEGLVARLAAAEEASLSEALRDELRATMDDRVSPRLELAGAASAILLKLALEPGEDEWDRDFVAIRRGVLLPRLAELTRERLLRTQPPAGARWARSAGCGTRIEGAKEHWAVGCGMGHVPERSQRFLTWLSDGEREL